MRSGSKHLPYDLLDSVSHYYSSSQSSSEPLSTSNLADSHKNEGFLKSAWHKLTHQHDNLTSDDRNPSLSDSKTTNKTDEEEPKKAAGSG